MGGSESWPLCACPRRRRSSFAAEAAARPVPLKRQSLDVSLLTHAESAGLPADSGDDATDQPWVGPNRDPLCACPRQRRASFAAEAAEPRRQFTDTCRVAGLPADRGRRTCFGGEQLGGSNRV